MSWVNRGGRSCVASASGSARSVALDSGTTIPNSSRMPVDPVDGRCTFDHQTFTHAVKGRQCLLRFRAGLYEAHRGPRCSLADRFGVDVVVLVALHKRPYVLSPVSVWPMPHRIELACKPV